MQIKATTRSGKPVLYSPQELVRAAVLYGIKMHNSSDKIYWALEKTIKVVDLSSFEVPKATSKSDTKFHAKVSGTVNIGYTIVKTDRFFDAKPYKFYIEYESAKDNLGLPDIKVTKAEIVPIEQNKSKHVSYEALIATQDKLLAHAKEFKEPKVKNKVTRKSPSEAMSEKD